MASATASGRSIKLGPSRAPKARVIFDASDYTCWVDAGGLRARGRSQLAQRRVERDESAIRIANKTVTGPTRINVVSRDYTTSINSRGPGAFCTPRSRAWRVKRDNRW